MFTAEQFRARRRNAPNRSKTASFRVKSAISASEAELQPVGAKQRLASGKLP